MQSTEDDVVAGRRVAASVYPYPTAHASHTNSYLLPHILSVFSHLPPGALLFELGCGNGAVAAQLAQRGYRISGVDPSLEGIQRAREAHPSIDFSVGSSEEDLAFRFGSFDAVMSLEVIEHVYAPRGFAKCVFSLLKPGGIVLLSTPYHGYLKNLAIALVGGFDRHLDPLWDNGHIKFWSVRSLSRLLQEAGFVDIEFRMAGRFPALAKSMLAVARRP